MIGYYHAISHLDPLVDRCFHRMVRAGATIGDPQEVNSMVKALKKQFGTSNLKDKIGALIDDDKIGSLPRVGATGTFCTKSYSLMGSDSDMVQATESRQPLLLLYSGEKYAFCGTSSSDHFSTPVTGTIAAVTGDFQITAEYKAHGLPVGGEPVLSVGSSGGVSIAFGMGSSGGGFLALLKGGVTYNYSSTVGLGNYNRRFWRVTRNATTGDINFYTSTDGATYTQLGATVPGITGAIDTPAGTARAGATSFGRTYIYSIEMLDAIGGDAVLNFDCVNYDVSVSQNTWTDNVLGATWTIVRSSVLTGHKTQIVYQTTKQGDGTDDTMETTGGTLLSLAGSNVFTYYAAHSQFNLVTGVLKEIYGSNNYYVGHNTAETFLRAITTAMQVFSPSTYIANKLLISACVSNGAQSRMGINNSYTNGTLNTMDVPGNSVKIFNAGGGSFYNGNINTFVLTKQADDASIRSSMYDFIRDLNGNPAT